MERNDTVRPTLLGTTENSKQERPGLTETQLSEGIFWNLQNAVKHKDTVRPTTLKSQSRSDQALECPISQLNFHWALPYSDPNLRDMIIILLPICTTDKIYAGVSRRLSQLFKSFFFN